MTILCVTRLNLPGIRACVHRGDHTILCPDHPLNRAIESHLHGYEPAPVCGGCLPRKAETGFLCRWCFEALEQAWLKWDRFASLLAEAGNRAVVRDTGGRSSTPDGYVPYPGTYLAYDECLSFLAGRRSRPLTIWVSNEEGAAHAIQFARAAERAYRTHEVEERPHRIRRVRCPKCSQLTLVWNPTSLFGGHVEVKCSNEECGEVLDQGSFEQVAEIEENSRRRA
jgi:ribosomal protein S27E